MEWDILTCKFYDAISVNFVPRPKINLGPDTALCTGDSIILDAGNPGLKHAWNNGDTNEVIIDKVSNKYIASVSNNFCEVKDDININFITGPYINLKDYYTLSTDKNEQVVLYPGPANSYLWEPSNQTDSLLIITTPPQFITLTVADARGCKSSKNITVGEICGPRLFVPNAFSPNRNNLNDEFLPKGVFVLSFEMNIYNRWGEKVFHSSDLKRRLGW